MMILVENSQKKFMTTTQNIETFKSGNLITFLRNLYKIYIHMRRTSVYSHKFDEQKVNCNRNSIENKVELYVIQI